MNYSFNKYTESLTPQSLKSLGGYRQVHLQLKYGIIKTVMRFILMGGNILKGQLPTVVV